MIGLKLCGTGSCLPENIVANDAFTAIIETSDEWIQSRTGIETRHIADGDTTWSMGLHAAQNALKSSGIAPDEVDLILVSTVTPDYITPSVSCILQQMLGAHNAACIDINCACSGFVYALDMAHRYLACGDFRTVLIVSSEMLSRITDFTDRSTCVLFGDGAGAVVVQAGDGVFASHIGANGDGYNLIYCKNPPPTSPFSKKPQVEDEISKTETGIYHLTQVGREVYKFATKMMPEAIETVCKKAGIKPEELDFIIPHQANIRIVQTAMKNLGLPMEKAFMNIARCGNTSSASIPLALDELARTGGLKKGDKVCTVGFGAGLTYGACIFEY